MAGADKDSAYCKGRDTMVGAGGDPSDELDLELATIASWCAAHGLAEMAGFKQFEHLKEACGGAVPFLPASFAPPGPAPPPPRGSTPPGPDPRTPCATPIAASPTR